jgi:alkaline phosphatase D
MQSFTPNQLVLLGDQIYPDFHPKYKYKRPYATPEMIAGEYNKFLSQPGWKNLTSSLSHDWLATYDDHDYGINNGDKTYQYRNESMAMFRQFYGKGGEAIEVVDPNTGETRSERKSGVYSAREFSFPIHPKDSNSKFFRYKIILLDNRSNKDPRGTVNGTMLGEQQWQWLEDQLSADNLKHLDLVLLGTGIQVIANDKLVEENWGDFPEERKRLINLVSRTQYYHTNIVMLSGET